MPPDDSTMLRRLCAGATVLLTVFTLLLSAAPAAAQAAEPHYAAGVAAFAAGDYAKTITEMNASLAAAPSGKAALYLGNAHLKLGQLSAAKAALQRALQLDPGNPKRESILLLIKGIDARNAAKVTITSIPPGATIYLDNQNAANARGRAPVELSIPPGKREVIAVLEGHETEKRVQQFHSGETLTISFPLRPKGCDLSLNAQPTGTRASVDGLDPAPLPATVRVAVGTHKVVFTAAGFESKEQTIACDGTKPLTAEATLVAAVPVGRVKFPATPGTVIAIDGKVLSADETVNGVTLPVGRHEVTFTVGNRPPYTQIIEVSADAEVAVPPVGRVKVVATPGMVIAIDGKVLSAGETLSGITLPVGRHTVVFTVGNKPPFTQFIDVTADAEVAVAPPAAAAAAAAPPPPPPRIGFPERALYAGVVGGGNFTLQPWNLGTDTKGAHPVSSATGGVRVGVQLFPRLAGEGSLRWVGLPNRLDFGHGLATELNVLFHILRGKWTPIVEGGAGTYHVLSSDLGKDADFRAHLGVGLRGLLKNWLAVRASVRDVITDGFDDKGIGNNLEVLLGVEAFVWEKKAR